MTTFEQGELCGSRTHAATAPADAECLITFDDIDESNYCEYQTAPSMLWYPAKASSDAIEHLRRTQYRRYVERVQATDCAAEMKRLLTAGPPIYVEERNVMPLPDSETHVVRLWTMADDTEVDAVLEGALQGDERQAFWDELVAIHSAVSATAQDEPSNGGGATSSS